MILLQDEYMYNKYDFNIEDTFMNNRLFATFTIQDDLDKTLDYLVYTYEIMYNKLFVLFVKDTNEYVITYNIEQGNVNKILPNTILLHRKKEYNVLYSINALNELIKTLNHGNLDTSYPINWGNYKNSILLTQHGEFKQLNTKLYQIIDL